MSESGGCGFAPESAAQRNENVSGREAERCRRHDWVVGNVAKHGYGNVRAMSIAVSNECVRGACGLIPFPREGVQHWTAKQFVDVPVSQRQKQLS